MGYAPPMKSARPMPPMTYVPHDEIRPYVPPMKSAPNPESLLPMTYAPPMTYAASTHDLKTHDLKTHDPKTHDPKTHALRSSQARGRPSRPQFPWPAFVAAPAPQTAAALPQARTRRELRRSRWEYARTRWITLVWGHYPGVMVRYERMAAWRCRGTKGRRRAPRSWSWARTEWRSVAVETTTPARSR